MKIMKDEIFRKGLIIGVICVLMIPSVAVASTENNSNYNLNVKIKNTKFYMNTTTHLCLSVNVSNEGPDSSDNYSCKVEIYRLISRHTILRDQFHWLNRWTSYTGSEIAPGGYEKKLVTIGNPGSGWFIIRCNISSGDNNPKDNVSYCFLWVPDLSMLRSIFRNLFP
jgi:hypothetical protein